jgi:hypothetical protein
MRAIAAGLLGLFLASAAHAEERPRVKVDVSFTEGQLTASQRKSVELGAAAVPESVPFGDGTATFAVKVVPAAAGCYLARVHVVVERPGAKRAVSKAALEVCGDRPTVKDVAPPPRPRERVGPLARIEVMVVPAES